MKGYDVADPSPRGDCSYCLCYYDFLAEQQPSEVPAYCCLRYKEDLTVLALLDDPRWIAYHDCSRGNVIHNNSSRTYD